MKRSYLSRVRPALSPIAVARRNKPRCTAALEVEDVPSSSLVVAVL